MSSFEAIRAAVETFVGERVLRAGRLEGGDEADVWRIETDGGATLVAHASPPWRTRGELEWTHSVARHAGACVPEVVAARPGPKGSTVLEAARRLVAVYGFVDGDVLDRDDEDQRLQAAALLARIHTALVTWTGAPRPARSGGPQPGTGHPDLHDAELEAWWSAVKDAPLVRAPTHGDYYRRNLLVRDGRIEGVIDWHESAVEPLVGELAFATWELCHDEEHRLVPGRAPRFVGAYRDAGGPVPAQEYELVLPFMRHRLRENIRWCLAEDALAGRAPDERYLSLQLRAFASLRSLA